MTPTILTPRVGRSEAGRAEAVDGRFASSRWASKPSIDAEIGAREKGGWVVSLLDPATGLFQYEAFLHLLLRETGRGTRYRDFFTLCLFKPDVPAEDTAFEAAIETALSSRIAEFIRATDIVGRFPMGLGVLLLHTGHAEAVGVASAFEPGSGGSSFGAAQSCPRDG